MKKKYDVAIITGWSNIGGSTESHINLTNELNRNNIKTILIGPHPFHLDKCEGALLSDVPNITCENIIWHFLKYDDNIAKSLGASNKILSCHEHNINKIFLRYNVDDFDHIHFVSEHQKQYQFGYSPVGSEDRYNASIITNILDPALKRTSIPDKKIGGVIGSIDINKQTLISIQKALEDSCTSVNVFGGISDKHYFMEFVHPIIQHPNVNYYGVELDKNKIYSSVTDVYHYALKETWGYIRAECEYLNIPYHSNSTNPINIMSTQDIITKWRRILK
jgi:hypothetical protein